MLSSQFLYLNFNERCRPTGVRDSAQGYSGISEKKAQFNFHNWRFKSNHRFVGENELDLSRTLKEKWRILEEISARTIYRRLPSVPQESGGMISATLKEMNAVVLEALREVQNEAI
jgi:hypothetical protein